jgi:hypothetical protein
MASSTSSHAARNAGRRNELISAAIKVAGMTPKGTHAIPGKPQSVIWERFAMVSAERPWCW